jgi:hypothetical protein
MTDDPDILRWLCSPSAAPTTPITITSPDNGRPTTTRSTRWAIPPDIGHQHLLSNIHYDPGLPNKMMVHLAVLIRKDRAKFDAVDMSRIINEHDRMNDGIPRVQFDPNREESTEFVTQLILCGLTGIAGILDLGYVEHGSKKSCKKIGYEVDWAIEIDERVRICYESKSQRLFDNTIDAITGAARNDTTYPRSVWEEQIRDSTKSILGKVEYSSFCDFPGITPFSWQRRYHIIKPPGLSYSEQRDSSSFTVTTRQVGGPRFSYPTPSISTTALRHS